MRFEATKHPGNRGNPPVPHRPNFIEVDGEKILRPRHRSGKNRPICQGKPIHVVTDGVAKAV